MVALSALAACDGGVPAAQAPTVREADAGIASPRAGDPATPGATGSAQTSSPAPSADAAAATGHPLTDEQVLETLKAMDAAIQEGDVEAFLQHVDPAIEQEQRAWFETLQDIPMDVREIRLDGIVSRNSTQGTVATVGLRHQVTGGDPEPMVEQYRWVLALGADGVGRLVDSSGRVGDFFGHPQIWDRGEPVAVLEDAHVLVLTSEDRREDAELLLDSLDRAAERTLAALAWAADDRQRFVVVLAESDHLEEVAGSPGWAHVAQPMHQAPDEIPWERSYLVSSDAPVSDRLLLDAEMTLQDVEEYGTGLGGNGFLRYIAASAGTMGSDPNGWPEDWLMEGFPNWWATADDPDGVAYQREIVGQHHQVAGRPDRLPAGPQDPDDQTAYDSYALESIGLALYLAETYGEDTLVQLVGELIPLDTRFDDAEIEQAYADTLGVDRATLVQGWAAWTDELAASVPSGSPGSEEG